MQIFAGAFDLWDAHRFIVYVIYRIFSCVPIKVFVIEKISVFILLQTIHFSSPVINRFKKGSNSLRLRCQSQALMRFIKWISFDSCGIQISSFLTSQDVVYDGRLLILVYLTFLQSLIQLHEYPIRLWVSFGHHQLHLADLNVAHLWVKNSQNGM